MTAEEFFKKYPESGECHEASDGTIHFNRTDAELHARLRGLSEKVKRYTREGVENAKKPLKTQE